MSDDFFVEIEASSNGHFVCDRCGESFRQPTAGTVGTMYTFDPSKTEGDEKEECHLLASSAQEIDIAQDVLDALVLAVPGKCLCSEACAGLCPSCGKNRNEGPCDCGSDPPDSRWDALKKLSFE